jgi:hypothetical protein
VFGRFLIGARGDGIQKKCGAIISFAEYYDEVTSDDGDRESTVLWLQHTLVMPASFSIFSCFISGVLSFFKKKRLFLVIHFGTLFLPNNYQGFVFLA